MLKYLKNKGYDLKAKGKRGTTPLKLTVIWSQSSSVVEYHIECRADVECCDKNGLTVLHHACRKGLLEVVKSLKNLGCDLNAKTQQGFTPLRLAVIKSHSSAAEYLIECGADMERCDKNGLTALYHACRKGSLEVMKYFKNKGCDLSAKNRC